MKVSDLVIGNFYSIQDHRNDQLEYQGTVTEAQALEGFNDLDYAGHHIFKNILPSTTINGAVVPDVGVERHIEPFNCEGVD